MNVGWVKLHRKFKDWEWYNKSEMVHLFIHCLIKANYESKMWQGENIEIGSFVTSLQKLSIDTGISVQTIRTCLKKLEKTNEIVVKSTNKLTKISICKYESYQSESETANKQLTNNQQTTNKQLTTTKEYKEYKEYKEDNPSSTKNEFSQDVFKTFDYLVHFFDGTKPENESAKNKWLDCIEKLNRIDGLTFKEICEIVKYIKNDYFWKTNFLSIMKLRTKNQEGIAYWNVFKLKMQSKPEKKQLSISFYKPSV